jgi:hypothetical protein
VVICEHTLPVVQNRHIYQKSNTVLVWYYLGTRARDWTGAESLWNVPGNLYSLYSTSIFSYSCLIINLIPPYSRHLSPLFPLF